MSNKGITGSKTLPDKEIDASIDLCCWLILCPCTFGFIPYKTTIKLDGEEVTKIDVNLCGKAESKRPYGELGSVAKSNCCCCVSVHSSFGEISPGCGCQEEKCTDLVEELKARQRTRGDTAQIQRVEQTLERLDHIEAKVDLLLNHMNIPQPATAQKMEGR
mmetsp:Transcript_33378/g.73602  ORF Transcript_33378/g.73602 Transcript_33378/m.73602 type:complete len:161 (-) Transcript_33378:282-764(-)